MMLNLIILILLLNEAKQNENLCTEVGMKATDECRKYKWCTSIGKEPYVQSCPEGLLFDENLKVCNWPSLVTCSEKTVAEHENSNNQDTQSGKDTSANDEKTTIRIKDVTPQENKETSTKYVEPVINEKPFSDKPIKEDGQNENVCTEVGMKATDGCKKFKWCTAIGKEPIIQSCQEGLLFDDNLKVCNWPSLVTCSDKTASMPDNSDTADTQSGKDTSANDEKTTTRIKDVPKLNKTQSSDSDKILLCYYTNWAKYRPGKYKFLIDDKYATLCTHIAFAFCKIDAFNFKPASTDPWSDLPGGGYNDYHAVTSLKNKNPKLKVLLSVGGWRKLIPEFQKMSSTDENARRFAKNTKAFLNKYNFDGFDVDWEYPDYQKAAFVRLVKAMSDEFKKDSKTYMLTIAVSAGVSNIEKSYDIPEISKYVDYINLMTYDFYGQFSDRVGHHTGLYGVDDEDTLNTDYAVRFWHANGAPLEKLLIGSPTYGQGFKTATKNPKIGDKIVGSTPLGPATQQSGVLAYIEFCDKGYENVWDDKQKVAHGVKGQYWLGYETKRSIKEKAKYVKENSLAGMFVWTVAFDDFSGNICKDGKSPLITQMHRSLGINPGSSWDQDDLMDSNQY